MLAISYIYVSYKIIPRETNLPVEKDNLIHIVREEMGGEWVEDSGKHRSEC